MKNLNLPEFKIPELRQKAVSGAVFYKLFIKNIVMLHKAGVLKKILEQQNRKPVNVRFKIT